jgi:hypothetical protein
MADGHGGAPSNAFSGWFRCSASKEDGAEGVTGSVFIARRRFQGRKGEIGRKDSALAFLEREDPTAAWGGRRCLTRGAMLSAIQRRRKARQLASWASGRVRPKAGCGERRARSGVTGRGEEVGCRAESEKKGNFLFFLFNYFKAFSNDFET